MQDDFLDDANIDDLIEKKQSTLNENEQAVLRFPILFLVDISGSTGKGGNPDIEAINETLNKLIQVLKNPKPGTDLETNQEALDICVLTYSEDVFTNIDWCTVRQLPDQMPEKLKAQKTTYMGGAIRTALLRTKERIKLNQKSSTESGMPHIFHITDGYPTDMKIGDKLWNSIQERLFKLTNSDDEKEYVVLYNFITPQGLTDRKWTNDGKPINGRDIMALLSGPETVKTISDDIESFQELIRFIALVISAVSNHYPPGEVLNTALAEYKEGQG